MLKERASPENTGGATAVKITEEEVERNYTPKEREFVDSFLVEFEAADEPQADEDDLAVYSNDYKMYAGGGAESLNIEWDAAMGKADHWDLPPFEDFDPKVGRSWVSCANEACCLFVCLFVVVFTLKTIPVSSLSSTSFCLNLSVLIRSLTTVNFRGHKLYSLPLCYRRRVGGLVVVVVVFKSCCGCRPVVVAALPVPSLAVQSRQPRRWL